MCVQLISVFACVFGGLAHLARASRSDREGGRFDLHTANKKGGLAHLARALRWQCRGDRFESGILHVMNQVPGAWFFI